MTLLNNVVMIAADSARSKAYLQAIVQAGFTIKMLYIMDEQPETLITQKRRYSPNRKEGKYFSLDEPLVYTADRNGIAFTVLATGDINSDVVLETLREESAEYVIYSGFGGQLLRGPLFTLGKRFLHVHAGILPQYRGSTTVYYSMLKERYIGASAIFLSQGIDEGNVIASERYDIPPKGVDIDYDYEPYVRSQVLIKALRKYQATGEMTAEIQSGDASNTYYIIHPVLKTLAIMCQSDKETGRL